MISRCIAKTSEKNRVTRFSGIYTDDWRNVARGVKDTSNWMCARCGNPHDRATGHVLTVHHLDGNKGNNAWWNVVPLCQRCHLTIQGKVRMERPWLLAHSDWFKPYVAGYYAFYFGLPDDRAFVDARIDALIALGQGKIGDLSEWHG